MFLGTGEKLDGLEVFNAGRLAGRILGMGDVLGLVEKAQAAVTQEEAERLGDRLKKGEFTLEDFLEQLRSVRKMGPLEDLIKMIPGVTREAAEQLGTQKILGTFRGDAPINRAQLAATLLALSRVAHERPDVNSVDVNPLIVRGDGSLVAVDALVETSSHTTASAGQQRPRPTDEQFRALFEPRGVAVVGAVFDGHRGAAASEYMANSLERHLEKSHTLKLYKM